MLGTIIRLCSDRGFGFAVEDETAKSYFINANDFKVAGTFDRMSVGDRLRFDPLNTPRGLKANRIERLVESDGSELLPAFGVERVQEGA